MTLLLCMASVLLFLALCVTALLIWAAIRENNWPALVAWMLLIIAVATDAMILKSESVWFWLKLFW